MEGVVQTRREGEVEEVEEEASGEG